MHQDTLISSKIVLLQVEAVKLIAEGKAPRISQPEEGATYECIQKKDNAKVAENVPEATVSSFLSPILTESNRFIKSSTALNSFSFTVYSKGTLQGEKEICS